MKRKSQKHIIMEGEGMVRGGRIRAEEKEHGVKCACSLMRDKERGRDR